MHHPKHLPWHVPFLYTVFIGIIQLSTLPSRVPRSFVGLFLVFFPANCDSSPLGIAVAIASARACYCTLLGASHLGFSATVAMSKLLFVLSNRCVLEASVPGKLSPEENTGGLFFAVVDGAMW